MKTFEKSTTTTRLVRENVEPHMRKGKIYKYTCFQSIPRETWST